MATRKFSSLICKVFAADRAARVLFVGVAILAIGIGDLNLWQLLNNLFACRRGSCATSLLLGESEDVLQDVFIACERAEVHVEISKE